MKVTHEDQDFYEVLDAPKVVRDYLRALVPATHRRYEPGPPMRWLVHYSAVIPIIRLAIESGVPTTYKALWPIHNQLMLESPSWNKAAQLSGGKKVDPFAVLFLTRDAPVFMIEAAWKALARQHHPDLGGNTMDFQRVKDAYEEIKQHATKSDGDDTKKSS